MVQLYNKGFTIATHVDLTASFLLNLALLKASAVGMDSTLNPDSSLHRELITSFTLTLFSRCIFLVVC